MDRGTKLVLVVIAAGLWANVAVTFVLPARAATDTEVWLGRLTLEVQKVAADLHDLVSGSPLGCSNSKLCP
jgi:hypothetical protein